MDIFVHPDILVCYMFIYLTLYAKLPDAIENLLLTVTCGHPHDAYELRVLKVARVTKLKSKRPKPKIFNLCNYNLVYRSQLTLY
jgi:hypothetical protein